MSVKVERKEVELRKNIEKKTFEDAFDLFLPRFSRSSSTPTLTARRALSTRSWLHGAEKRASSAGDGRRRRRGSSSGERRATTTLMLVSFVFRDLGRRETFFEYFIQTAV